MGSRISNSDPRSGSLVEERRHLKSPPSFLDKPLATNSPSPKPSLLLVVESSSRAKGWKRFGRKSSGIPVPVSLILIKTHLPELLNFVTSVMVPDSVNLRALIKTQDTNLVKSLSSTYKISGTEGSTNQSIIFVEARPFEDLDLISIFCPNMFGSTKAESGRPPTWSDSWISGWSISRILVDCSVIGGKTLGLTYMLEHENCSGIEARRALIKASWTSLSSSTRGPA
ncbi:hypothetical protein ACKS0A_01476 [Histoplasma ohiense]